VRRGWGVSEWRKQCERAPKVDSNRHFINFDVIRLSWVRVYDLMLLSLNDVGSSKTRKLLLVGYVSIKRILNVNGEK
jgi:hypothetical protein